jgi:hypothetical protein
LTGSEASHVSVGREGPVSHFTPDDATVSRRRHVSVKFKDDNPYSAIKALGVIADETAPGLTAPVGLVSSRVGTFPFCWAVTADPMQSETRINRVPTVRP